MSESDERSPSCDCECKEDEEEGMAVRPLYEPIDAHICDAIYIT